MTGQRVERCGAGAIRWSVVIPAYNEEHRLPLYLREITAYFDGRGEGYEVIVVDDGSRDATAQVVQSLRQRYPAVRLLRLAQNSGKGYAVRTGMLDAKGEFLLLADADGATPISEIERLEAQILDGVDIAIGSRVLALRDKLCTVKAKWHRQVLGGIFNFFVRSLGVRGITDTQCGFKLFREPVAWDLFSVQRIDGYGFDVELLFVAQRRGYRVVEVPVTWVDQPGSKVSLMWDGLRLLREVVTVRRNHALGRYAPRLGPRTSSGRSTSYG